MFIEESLLAFNDFTFYLICIPLLFHISIIYDQGKGNVWLDITYCIFFLSRQSPQSADVSFFDPVSRHLFSSSKGLFFISK